MVFRKVCVACTNANGEPDIFFFKLGTCNPEGNLEVDYDNDEDDFYYEDIEGIAKGEDYEGPYVIWDETDVLFRNLDCESKFEWDSAFTWVRKRHFPSLTI